MSTEPSVRLFAIVARKAPVAAVFRRGPSKQVMLLRWDLTSDRFEAGQWLKGRIYERRCDLSPSGELLLYFGGNQKPPYYTWSAVSRLPFLTALALWPKGDTWGGGGLFEDERRIALDHRADQLSLAPGFRVPRGFEVGLFDSRGGPGDDLESRRLETDGWILESVGEFPGHSRAGEIWYPARSPRVWSKRHPRERYTLEMSLRGYGERNGPWQVLDFKLKSKGVVRDLGSCDWADFLPDGSLAVAREGRIIRSAKPLDETADRTIADLRDCRFEPVAAPESARVW